jgi:hypothetical protein
LGPIKNLIGPIWNHKFPPTEGPILKFEPEEDASIEKERERASNGYKYWGKVG